MVVFCVCLNNSGRIENEIIETFVSNLVGGIAFYLIIREKTKT